MMLTFAGTSFSQVYLSGQLRGVLVDTTYIIIGHCYVSSGTSLTIEAGATFYINYNLELSIYGSLRALGTEEDSIRFIRSPGLTYWFGIWISGDDSCVFRYCSIPHSEYGSILAYGRTLIMEHCTVTSMAPSRALSIGNSSAILSDCVIGDGATGYGGGGIQCSDSDVLISRCTISHNHCDSYGGGIRITDSRVRIDRCIITGNSANYGAGMYCSGYDSLPDVVVSNCLIEGNTAGEDGGGVYFETSIPTIENCTISGNSAQAHGAGIWCRNTVPNIVNTIVEGSREGSAVMIQNSLYTAVTYCDFYDNLEGDFYGDLPEGLGEIVAVNANGDSCDVYQNIFLDPLFVDPELSDYHLSAESPCIDAGDPTSPLDPDSTIADMGAFYYHHTSQIRDRIATIHPSKYLLHANYPNPFNSKTIIGYELPVSSHVTLTVYNALGRPVATLVRGWQQTGSYRVTFDGMGAVSGLYFYRLRAGRFSDSGRMILLR